MSKTYINNAMRRAVIERANGCCEYCRVNTQDRGINFAIDHIIAEKHGGQTDLGNLCLSCYWCNSFKGSDLSSVDWNHNAEIVPLFHPRQHHWNDHFRIDKLELLPLTSNGRVTVSLLQLNASQRIKERRLLIELGTYPCLF